MPSGESNQNTSSPGSKDRPLLLLVDGYSLLFRAYYSMGPLNAPDGTPSGGLFGMTAMLLKTIEDIKPTHVMMAFDFHGPTFRHAAFPEYKAHRDETDEDLKVQLPIARELMDAMGIAYRELEGYEADDVIGTMARRAEDAGWDVAVVTGDTDLGQLATDHVTVIQMLRGVTATRILDQRTLLERYGVPEPINLIDYKALVGDPSDNIPGVKGVGEKTAKKLLAQYPTIEEMYDNLDKIEEMFRKKLEASEDVARLSKDLITIRTDLPIELDEDAVEEFRFDLGEIDKRAASEMFSKLGFRAFLSKLDLEEIPQETGPQAPPIEWVVVDTEKALKELVTELKENGRFALDFETTSLDARTCDIVGVACAIDGKTGYYVPVGHEVTLGDEFTKQLPLKTVIDAFRTVWESSEIEKVCQNGKYEWLVCHRYGIELNGLIDDPMIADYLVDPDNRHGLKEMAKRILNWEMTTIEELIGKRGKKQKSMDQISIDIAAPYAAADATSTWLLAERLKPRLKKDGLADLYRKVEMPLVTVLARMEAVGIRVNPDVLKAISKDLGQRMEDVSKVIFQGIGQEINLNSPKQLAELLFDRMGLPKVRGRSTDAEVLEKLSGMHELPQQIIHYRTLAKLRGTYTEALIDLTDPDDGRIHTSYNQTIAGTGRLSSSDPNLQNIPIRTPEGREIRRAFQPNDPGDVLLSADYSQIELRLLAHYSEDKTLMEAFENDEDIHRRTAMEIFDVPADGVTPDMRRSAKTINFGIIYGMGAHGLSEALKRSRGECKQFIERFFERYPSVRDCMDRMIESGREQGYVTTLLGRRKYYPELKSSNRVKRAAAERAAINMPLQGSAADIIKLAMVELCEKLDEAGLPEAILLQVHDELVLSVPKTRLEEIANLTGNTMSGIYKLNVPLIVNCKAGPNWLDMEPSGDFRTG